MINTIKEKPKEERNYKVYIHRNKINGKVYIGVTRRKRVKDRWQNGNGYKVQVQFYNAIKKYGWTNFSHKVLYRDLTKKEAGEIEKDLINKYDSTNPLYGYNVDKGGFDITSEKISRLRNGKGKRSEPILLTSKFDRNLFKIFKDVRDASEQTGLTEEYILNVCERRIINKYYDFNYCRHVV